MSASTHLSHVESYFDRHSFKVYHQPSKCSPATWKKFLPLLPKTLLLQVFLHYLMYLQGLPASANISDGLI